MKELTKENWLTLDDVISSGVFTRLSLIEGSFAAMTPEDWAERLLAPTLLPTVPSAVRELYSVARGAMLYGCLFYPLFTLGLEQVYRVAETAAKAKATLLAIPLQTPKGKGKTLAMLLHDLLAQNAITKTEHDQWSMIREFRNLVSHPRQVTILPPATAISLLGSITETINRLFTSALQPPA